MKIKLLATFLATTLVAFIVLPIQMDRAVGGGGPMDELSINKEYVWLGGLKLLVAYKNGSLTLWQYEGGRLELFIESIVAGIMLTVIVYFFLRKYRASIIQ